MALIKVSYWKHMHSHVGVHRNLMLSLKAKHEWISLN